MKDKLIATRNHVVKHRFKYGLAAGLTAGLLVAHKASNDFNAFLLAEGLYDKYYAMEEIVS